MDTAGQQPSLSPGWRFAPFELHPAERRLLRDGVAVEVEERALDLLVLLAANHGRALNRREITAQLWGSRPVSDSTLRQLLYKARRAVDDDGHRQHVIRTLHGRSLEWVAPLTPIAVADPAPPVDTAAAVASGSPRPARSRRRWLVVAGVVAAVIVGVSVRQAAAPSFASPPRIAVAPIRVVGGAKSLGWTVDGLPGLLASLLGEAGGADVVDPLKSARAWRYKPRDGRTKLQQLRYVTHANVTISGRIRKLAGEMYELTLVVTADGAAPANIVVTGAKPGILIVDAVPRIRRRLGLDKPKRPSRLPRDPFVAEAYARGMDLAAHGEWKEAVTNFRICAREAPAFLPGRMMLGVAEYRSDAMADGAKTLRAVADDAAKRHDLRSEAAVLDELGDEQSQAAQYVDADATLRKAAALAPRAGDPHRQALIALDQTTLHADMRRLPQARRDLARAQALIARYQWPELEAQAWGAERELARKSGNVREEVEAARKQLAANSALGNQRAATGDLIALAGALLEQNHRLDALVLLDYGYRKARSYHDAFMSVAAGDYLAQTLLSTGVDARIDSIADTMVAISRRQHNDTWLGLSLVVHGAAAQYRGNAAAALGYYRKALALMEGAQNPQNPGDTLPFVAVTAYLAKPSLLPSLVKKIDTLVAAQANADSLRLPQLLVHALADSAAGRDAAALAALRKAADGKAGKKLDGNVRMVAFVIGRRDAAAAAIALKDFDPATWPEATDLRNYSHWAAARGDTQKRDVAEARIKALRRAALARLADASRDGGASTPPAPPVASGDH